MKFKDLSPRDDPKGGSPKSPFPPTSVSDYQAQTYPIVNGTALKVLSAALFTALIGMTVAWWTALQAKGVTRTEMEDYEAKHSSYLMDKPALLEQKAEQDKENGFLQGREERLFDRMTKLENDATDCARDRKDLRDKLDLITNWMEEQKRLKR